MGARASEKIGSQGREKSDNEGEGEAMSLLHMRGR